MIEMYNMILNIGLRFAITASPLGEVEYLFNKLKVRVQEKFRHKYSYTPKIDSRLFLEEYIFSA